MGLSKKWKWKYGEKPEKKDLPFLPIVLIALFVGGIAVFAFNGSGSSSNQSIGEIHWHATAQLSVCGEPKELPVPLPGQHQKGLSLMHTHDDGKLHIEGVVGNANEITLGKFMQAIGVSFTNDQFFGKKNGDACNGVPGKVTLLVNGKQEASLSDYSVKDGDQYQIKFE